VAQVRQIQLVQPAERARHVLDRLTTYKDADDGLDHGSARLLYAAYLGSLSPTDTSVDRMMKLGALANRRAITFGSGVGERVRLTDETAYAFDMSR
jgi:hypothetical protein